MVSHFEKKLLNIELGLILVYLVLFGFRLLIQPINIILGMICIFFLPGYNLLSLIKPKANQIEKIGYSTILSLAIDNILMFFYYILFYNFTTTNTNKGFIFNSFLLIFLISIINIILIFILKIKIYGSTKRYQLKPLVFEGGLNFKYALVYITFFLSLIFMCIATFYSNVPDNDFSIVFKDYKKIFTFFNRVHFSFYIFLTISISTLIYIIFFTKNKYLILISIATFIYCLWILPYIQIGNFFNPDSLKLKGIYLNYKASGIKAQGNYSFLIKRGRQTTYPYSTSIFTAILLTSACGVGIKFALWYLYPIILATIPFFFFSTFQKFSKAKANSNLSLIFLTILAIFTSQFLKYPHSATTMVIGTYIFFILVIEFYNLIHERNNKLLIRDFFIIIFLYLFLCLTRTEEGIYFLILMTLYGTFYLFFNSKKIGYDSSFYSDLNDENLNSESRNKDQIRNQYIIHKEVEKKLRILCLLLFILSVMFYLTREFFSLVNYNLNLITGGTPYLRIIFRFYTITKIRVLFFLKGTYAFSLFFIIMILFAVGIYFGICHKLIFQSPDISNDIYRLTKVYTLKILIRVKKITSVKIFQIILVFFIVGLIILINLIFVPFLETNNLSLMIEIFLSYSLIIFNIYLFILGIAHYKIGNHKQNYFLIAIISSASVMSLLFITRNTKLAYYLLSGRFFAFFVFFNLIIIQNNYFKEFMKKNKIQLILLMFFLFYLGTFYSLRKLSWG